MIEGEKTRRLAVLFASVVALILLIAAIGPGRMALADDAKTYVGSESCQQCHEAEYAKFMKSSKKPHSFQSIETMKKGLSESEMKECYACHTTGYGKPGGFVSEKETPLLKNAGCEVCHGPGSLHAETQNPKDIVSKVEPGLCTTCHNAERVDAFRFNSALFAGAH